MFGGLSSANHLLMLNIALSFVCVFVISTDAQCHDAFPKKLPLLSCPSLMRSISPTSGARTWNVSFEPRSKLSADVSSARESLSPSLPKMTSDTFASHPAPLMSEVMTSTTYGHRPSSTPAAFLLPSDGVSVTRGDLLFSQSSW